MNYISTRGRIPPVPFQDAVMMGLADDGGLLVPERIPDVRDRLSRWANLSYTDLAIEVLSLFVGDIPPDDLAELVRRTYDTGDVSPAQRRWCGSGRSTCWRLWHGPTRWRSRTSPCSFWATFSSTFCAGAAGG